MFIVYLIVTFLSAFFFWKLSAGRAAPAPGSLLLIWATAILPLIFCGFAIASGSLGVATGFTLVWLKKKSEGK